ncbi:MAG: hypothetical protein II620_07150 [Paludibacteraceae bacterium]|nr:hypothetical protein [Paludibacteraceae bacterium]
MVFGFSSCNRELKKEIEMLREELARQQQYVPLKKDTIHDSVEVVTQQIVEVEKIKEVLTKEDKQLIKDLSLKVSELESYQKIGTITKDSITLEKKDSTKDTPLYYKDAWAEFEYQDKKLRYAIRDSLAIAVKQEYKHRFLWWKWGVKGYEVKAINFNPHTTIKYNTYIKRKK